MITSSLSRKAPPSHAMALTALTPAAFPKWLDKQSQAVQNWLKANAFTGKSAGSSVMIPSHDGSLSRVIVILSEPVSLWDLSALPAKLPEGTYVLEGIKKQDEEDKLALGWLLGSHTFTLHKKSEEKTSTLCVSNKCPTDALTHLATIIAETRDLISTPAEELGPEELASAVQAKAKAHGAKVTVIVGDDLLKKNYPAIHAVGRASHRKPRLIDLTWGNPKHPKLTLIGKGVCFDTGGLDLKTGSGMFLMRKDMGGAAVALGVASLVMQRKLRVCLRLLIPAVDNAINDKAFRPSDVITMRSGVTVEIGNTDAEGRMVLADALTEGASEKPDLMIDFATLGYARSIFGEHMASLFTTDDGLAKDLMKAGEQTEDYIWRLPLHPPYADKLKTPFADLNSCPPAPYGNAMIAAAFLQKFAQDAPRALHLDFIAWHSGSKAGRPEGGEAMTLRAVLAMLEKRYA